MTLIFAVGVANIASARLPRMPLSQAKQVTRKEAREWLHYGDKLRRLNVKCHFRFTVSHVRCPVFLSWDSPFAGPQCTDEFDTYYGTWHDYRWVQVFHTYSNNTFSTYKSEFRPKTGLLRCPGK